MADPLPILPPTKPAPWPAVIGLAYLTLGLFGYALYCLLKTNDTQLVSNMIIAVIGFVGTGLGFYFGSSSSSAKKDDAATTLALTAAGTGSGNTEPSDAAKALAAVLPPA